MHSRHKPNHNRSWKDASEVPLLTPVTDRIGHDILGLCWFWNETETQAYGPFRTFAECEIAMNSYGNVLNRMHNVSVDVP